MKRCGSFMNLSENSTSLLHDKSPSNSPVPAPRQPTAIKPQEYAAQLRVAARRSSLTTDNARL
jgi:hypothetical protein